MRNVLSKLRIYHLCSLLLLAGCISPPSYPVEPEIKFLSLSRTVINQQDSVRVKFEFKDGDGDLGFQSTDTGDCNLCDTTCLQHPTFSLFLFDNRTSCLTPYNIPYIPPKGSSDAISGKVDFVVSLICCIPPNNFPCIPSPDYPQDTVRYSIQLKDRAGHLSNKLELPPILIHCN